MLLEVRDRIIKLKSVYSIIAVLLFIASLGICTYFASDLELSEISLSRFGINEKTSYVWNITLFIIALFLYVDALRHVLKFHSSDIISRRLVYLFSFSSLCLLLTAVIDMTYRIHNYTATAYFIGYTIAMFLFGYKLLATDFRIGISSIIISICSAVLPIILNLFISGLAIPEIVHTTFIFLWVSLLSFEVEYKKLLKLIGF